MTIVDILRAKSKDEENYLLKDHLKETILRAKQLKDFINKNKSAIKYNKFDDNFFEDLIIACFLHDLGKIDFNFQKDVFKKEERETKEFNEIKNFFGSYKKINIKDHEVISLLYSLIFLDNNDRSEKIRTAILLHHYNEFYANRDNINIRYIFDDYPDLRIYIEFLINNKERIEELLKNLLQYILDNIEDDFTRDILTRLKNNISFDKLNEFKQFLYRDFGLSTKLKLFNLPDKEDERNLQLFYDFFVFLGCLRRCDYSASGNVDIEDAENLKEYVYKDLNEKIKDNIKSKDIWQEKILEQKDYNNMVLIAPTGSGKTEFALLWAKNRSKKLIYTLPLRVALNDLYCRFADKEKGYFENDLLSILHSTSFIEYLKEDKYGEELDVGEKQTISKLFSSPLTLTTPDQVFLSSLKYYGFDKIVSTYPLSAIVIDEIQAYNPEMAAVIIKTLKIIKELFGNLLIITATFPPYFRKYVNEEDFKIIDVKEIDDEIKRHVKNYNLKRHRIDLLNYQIFKYEENEDNKLRIDERSFEKLKEILVKNRNKNILIILNNVGKSIELFKKLENDNEIKERIIIKDKSDETIQLLLHSRIIEKGKSKRIEAIKKALEKGEKGMVVVSTQLVETSVDIDFDLLITEISPIDSQIQRWGRIYRNRNNDYNDDHPNIFIFLGIDRGTSAIYDKRVIEKTIEVLKKYQGKLLDYEAERDIIEEVFNTKIDNENKTLKDVFIKEVEDNLEWLEYVSLEKRSEAQRAFRRIAGIQVVIPDLMLKGSEIERAFGELIKDKNNWKLPFESESSESLVNKVKEKVSDNVKNQVTRWKLLEILYNYSFNLPFFSVEYNTFEILERNNFKGFFVLKTDKVSKDEILEIEKYGINKIKDIDIDALEIETYVD